MNLFKVGDRVIYPNQGLGIIEDIQETAYFGEKCKVYHLRILCNDTLVLVPSTNTQEIGIRKPIEEDNIEEIFSILKEAEVDVSMNWKGRYKEHLNLMKSGTIPDMVAVLKCLFYLSLLKPLSFREKKMMERAKDLIVVEISEATSMPEKQVEKKLLDTLSLCFKDTKSSLDY